MKSIEKVRKLLLKNNYDSIEVSERDDIVFLKGVLTDWNDIVKCGKLVAGTKLFSHVVNEIELKDYVRKPMKTPSIEAGTSPYLWCWF